MRGLVLTAAALSIAAPAAAFMARLRLPVPTPRVDYVETRCLGGDNPHDALTRVQADGLVLRTTWRTKGVLSVRATAVQAVKIIHRARFDPRPGQRPTGPVCVLVRFRNGLMSSTTVPDAGGSAQDGKMRRVIAGVKALGDRAKTPFAWPADRRGY